MWNRKIILCLRSRGSRHLIRATFAENSSKMQFHVNCAKCSEQQSHDERTGKEWESYEWICEFIDTVKFYDWHGNNWSKCPLIHSHFHTPYRSRILLANPIRCSSDHCKYKHIASWHQSLRWYRNHTSLHHKLTRPISVLTKVFRLQKIWSNNILVNPSAHSKH